MWRASCMPRMRAHWKCAISPPSSARRNSPNRIAQFLSFAEAFEKRFIGQSEDEDRSIFDTLNLAWDLLSLLPPDTLSRVSEDELRKYHHYAPGMAGEPA